MSIRSFKQLFSIVVSLILACLGLLLGFAVKEYIARAPNTNISFVLDLFKRVAASHPSYLSWLASAICALGLLSGAIIGPIAADWLINAGNAVERMSPR